MLFRKSSLWITVTLLVGTLLMAACAAPTPTPPPTQPPPPTATTVAPPTVAPSPTPTVAPTATATRAPTATATATVTPSPTSTVAPTATPTRTPIATATATVVPTSTSIAVPTATATPQSGAVSANIVDFAHMDLTIRVGATVTWTNTGDFPHTTTSGMFPSPSGVWNSGTLNAGQPFSRTFTQAGSFPYFCSFHGMQATVTVVP